MKVAGRKSCEKCGAEKGQIHRKGCPVPTPAGSLEWQYFDLGASGVKWVNCPRPMSDPVTNQLLEFSWTLGTVRDPVANSTRAQRLKANYAVGGELDLPFPRDVNPYAP